MDGSDGRSSTGIDRRASTRLSIPQQHQHDQHDQHDEHDDEDDFALAAMGMSGASDGFRPAGNASSYGGHRRMSSSQMSQNTDTQNTQNTPNRPRTPPPRPSSTTKPPGLDSFALRHDGAMGPSVLVHRNSTLDSYANAVARPRRSSSVSTDVPYVRPESPYRGPTGPSHAYAMYPQESRLARTASVATASTVQVPDRPYNGPGGPTHPYGMYPQNIVADIVAEAESPDEPAVPPIPVGFPGLNNDYQRRLGPEGEEMAGIIGPDGHSEELPPYTQYPDEALARKTRPTVQVPVVAGAGGIGLAPRNPEFDSRENLNSPESRQSTRSIMSDASNHEVNVAAIQDSDKAPPKRWKQVARKRCCGIVPYWAIGLAAVTFVLFAAILAITLVLLKPKHPQKKHPSPDQDGGNQQSIVLSTMTTTFDATPFTTLPSGIPTLPTGTYALPISAPSTIQNSCIEDTQESAAWSCTIPMTPYTIAVTPLGGTANQLHNNEINLSLGNNTFGNYYSYGTQPPVLTQDQVLNLVTDSQEPARGPAWFFELPYNKIVILPEGALQAPTAKRDLAPVERDSHAERDPYDSHGPNAERGRPPPPPALDFMRKDVAQPGDKPWFCFWNGTLLEAFIYVNLTSNAGSHQSTTTSASSSPTSSGVAARSYSGGDAGSTTTVTSTYGPGSRPSQTNSGSSPSSSSPPGGNTIDMPVPYPKVLKIEERRIPRGDQSISPYCVQHVIDASGAAQVFMNSTGQPTTIFLNETEPSSVSQITGRSSYEIANKGRDAVLDERQSSASSCGCVWLWT